MYTAAEWINKHPYLKQISLLYLDAYENMDKAAASLKMTFTEEEWQKVLSSGIPLLSSVSNEFRNEAVNLLKSLILLESDENLPKEFREACARIKSTENKNDNLCKNIIDCLISDDILPADLQKTSREVVYFLGWTAISRCLKPFNKEITEAAEQYKYNNSLCPVCGGEPSMAVFRKGLKGRQRFLICGRCRSEWLFKRIGCPYCGNENPKTLEILETEQKTDSDSNLSVNEPEIRVDVCRECGSYIKTVLNSVFPACEDWAWLHIDIYCRNKSLKKRGSLLAAE